VEAKVLKNEVGIQAVKTESISKPEGKIQKIEVSKLN
jgi:hypothetical protein